ncbi:MAG: DUF4198 domain-containing protein [Gemmataceae bacterium]|nr:DUF4198 domain-containing protein [Gemmataceae bacterium]
MRPTSRLFAAAGLTAALAAAAPAHFVFVVPQPGGKAVHVVFSDDLEPDAGVDIGKAAGLKLTARLADGKTAPVALKVAEHHLAGELPAGATAASGRLDYGVMQKGDAKPFLLVYHPRAVLAADPKADAPGEAAPVEIVPSFGGKPAFRVLAAGKPVAGVEVNVLLPDGGKRKVTTGPDGATPGFDAPGRYGAWARHTEPKAGELAGKKYEEVRHYATLVVDFPK